MRVVLLAGGVGGARFTRGLRDLGRAEGLDLDLTVVVNTGDDLWLDALRVCPDLDTVMYTLGGVIGDQGWGRAGESTRVTAELHAYGLGWDWFTLGDLDLGTHIARTELLRSGLPLSAVTARLCERWQPGATRAADVRRRGRDLGRGRGRRRGDHDPLRGVVGAPPRRAAGAPVPAARRGRVAPGARACSRRSRAADLVLLPPSNPVVSVGTILGVPGIRDAVRAARAPVVGVSPIIGGAPVRGMADACLTALGVETSARAVAEHYGARSAGGVLDGWLVDDADADAVAPVRAAGIEARALPLLMTDGPATARSPAPRWTWAPRSRGPCPADAPPRGRYEPLSPSDVRRTRMRVRVEIRGTRSSTRCQNPPVGHHRRPRRTPWPSTTSSSSSSPSGTRTPSPRRTGPPRWPLTRPSPRPSRQRALASSTVTRSMPPRTSTRITPGTGGGDPVLTDGPFPEVKEIVSGYYKLEVADRDQALALAAQCPTGGYVEVTPVMPTS